MKTLSPLMANKTVAAIAMLAIVMWSFVGIVSPALHAAALTSVSDTLSDSDLGVNSNHTIVFSNPENAINESDTIVVTFPGEFNLSTSTASLGIEDFDVSTSTANVLDYTCGTGVHMSVATNTPSTQAITFTVCSGEGGAVAAGGTTTISIGLNASVGGAGDSQIINPADAGSYEVTIATPADSGATRVAIIDDVVVTASVDTTFVFTINGMPTTSSVNGSPTTTAAASTATTLPFGTLTPDLSRTLAQNLTVTTNAANGFTVTVNQDQNLTSSTGADIDRFTDDSAVSSSTAWARPGNTIGSENTYGHMGVTSEDESLGDTDLTTHFYDDLWAGNFVGNPREVFYNDGPADGVSTGVGSTTVGFQVEVGNFQEAGSDYTANITYVATPVF